MRLVSHLRHLRALIAVAVCCASAAVLAQPKPEPVRLRVVGGLANVHQYTRHEEPFWTQDLARLSEGRASAEIVPFDRAGIRGQEMLRLVQIGAVPFGTALMSLSASLDAEVLAIDLAGLSPDAEAVRRHIAAYRSYLDRMLRERYGIELLAVYIYPAQQVFCTRPMKGLADLAGRRVRVSGPSQGDMIEALGGIPVATAFAEVVANVKSGNIECAITGTMSGNTIGLHEVTRYLHGMPITWGVSAFVANGAAWQALPQDVRDLIRRELPRLERDIWNEALRETGEGLACNVGAASCAGGRKGSMVLMPETAEDRRLLRETVTPVVLSRWLRRCGPSCTDVWQKTIGPVSGVTAR